MNTNKAIMAGQKAMFESLLKTVVETTDKLKTKQKSQISNISKKLLMLRDDKSGADGIFFLVNELQKSEQEFQAGCSQLSQEIKEGLNFSLAMISSVFPGVGPVEPDYLKGGISSSPKTKSPRMKASPASSSSSSSTVAAAATKQTTTTSAASTIKDRRNEKVSCDDCGKTLKRVNLKRHLLNSCEKTLRDDGAEKKKKRKIQKEEEGPKDTHDSQETKSDDQDQPQVEPQVEPRDHPQDHPRDQPQLADDSKLSKKKNDDDDVSLMPPPSSNHSSSTSSSSQLSKSLSMLSSLSKKTSSKTTPTVSKAFYGPHLSDK